MVYSSLCRRTIGYTVASNKVYFKVLHVLNKTHAEARVLCQEDGGRLADAPYGVEDKQAMWMFLAQLAPIREGGLIGVFLVDGSDAQTQNTWVLSDGALSNCLSYS
jgi:hypothetical protein